MKSKQSTKSNAMRQCSVRLPSGLHNYIVQEADEKGTTVGDIIRNACSLMQENISLAERVGQLEHRIVRKVFESQCIVAELSSTERDRALNDLKTRLKELAK